LEAILSSVLKSKLGRKYLVLAGNIIEVFSSSIFRSTAGDHLFQIIIICNKLQLKLKSQGLVFGNLGGPNSQVTLQHNMM
jgi:hypothetical protein